MELFFELLKISIPAVVVFITVYYILKQYFANELRKKSLEIRKGNQEYVIPVRLQAYERMALFLERIAPNAMVMRMPHTTLTAQEFQTSLLKTVRTEFEHNVAQQIYLSPKCWEMIKTAKEEVIKIINLSASQTDTNQPAVELSKIIIHEYLKLKNPAIKKAMELLKAEINSNFA